MRALRTLLLSNVVYSLGGGIDDLTGLNIKLRGAAIFKATGMNRSGISPEQLREDSDRLRGGRGWVATNIFNLP